MIFKSAADLGLVAGDDIDALAINRTGVAIVDGAFVSSAVEPSGWYSLTPGSPSLAAEDLAPGDIFLFELAGSYSSLSSQLHMTCSSIGLCVIDVGTDVDSLGHIDPEGIQGFVHCRTQLTLPDGSIDGFVGARAESGLPLAFGSEFGAFEGSYAVAVDQQPNPGGAVFGTDDPSVIGIVPSDPGTVSIVEFDGVRGSRSLADRTVLLHPPDPGAPPPVDGLTAAFDPANQTLTVDWNPAPGSAGTLLRVGPGPPMPQSPPVVIPNPVSGVHVVEARSFSAAPVGDLFGEVLPNELVDFLDEGFFRLGKLEIHRTCLLPRRSCRPRLA
ncbi:MAG: hypothetical protein D6815_06425 [Candidatus Dadabacteria bacterium]|nr:MAG: hypothetical protein D6815_06425 [Candidatus Dadabacteria bacterium]